MVSQRRRGLATMVKSPLSSCTLSRTSSMASNPRYSCCFQEISDSEIYLLLEDFDLLPNLARSAIQTGRFSRASLMDDEIVGKAYFTSFQDMIQQPTL